MSAIWSHAGADAAARVNLAPWKQRAILVTVAQQMMVLLSGLRLFLI